MLMMMSLHLSLAQRNGKSGAGKWYALEATTPKNSRRITRKKNRATYYFYYSSAAFMQKGSTNHKSELSLWVHWISLLKTVSPNILKLFMLQILCSSHDCQQVLSTKKLFNTLLPCCNHYCSSKKNNYAPRSGMCEWKTYKCIPFTQV